MKSTNEPIPYVEISFCILCYPESGTIVRRESLCAKLFPTGLRIVFKLSQNNSHNMNVMRYVLRELYNLKCFCLACLDFENILHK